MKKIKLLQYRLLWGKIVNLGFKYDSSLLDPKGSFTVKS